MYKIINNTTNEEDYGMFDTPIDLFDYLDEKEISSHSLCIIEKNPEEYGNNNYETLFFRGYEL